jgi:hypothetical protein
VRVECYSGYRGDERPIAFWLDDRRLGVEEVEDRWYGPDSTWFRVRADDGGVYVLRHRDDDCWSLEAYRGSNADRAER